MTKSYHFIGIGGAGMSVVAQLFHARGWQVTGSDRKDSATVQQLQAAGIPCWIGSDPLRIPAPSTIVRSSAIRAQDAELSYATESGWPILHRSEALALAAQDLQFIAVAGAHGKTTTSGMLAQALSAAGQDPSFAVGGIVTGFNTGARLGKGPLFVAEADESDASFLNYRPQVAIITNIEADHLDNYGTNAAFEQAFFDFTNRICPGGSLVLDTDDPGCKRLLERIRHLRAGIVAETPAAALNQAALPDEQGCSSGQPVTSKPLSEADKEKYRGLAQIKLWGYGRGSKPAGLDRYCLIKNESFSASSQRAVYQLEEAQEQTVSLRLPGAHNLANACAAYLAGVLSGVSPAVMAKALTNFQGTARRFEIKGEIGGIRVIDDYAHHPTEVSALIKQARQAAPNGHLLVLFQPHLFSRTKNFASRFAQALDQADYVIVTDIFAAREDPVPGITSELITSQMRRGKYVSQLTDAARQIASLAQSGDLVLTVGAGNVSAMGKVILDYLQHRFGGRGV